MCESQSQLHTQSLGIHKQLILMLSWMHSVYVGAGRGPRAALLITTVGVDRMDAGCLRTIFSPLPILASPSPCISIGGPQEPLPVTVCLHDNELLEENRAVPFSEKNGNTALEDLLCSRNYRAHVNSVSLTAPSEARHSNSSH